MSFGSGLKHGKGSTMLEPFLFGCFAARRYISGMALIRQYCASLLIALALLPQAAQAAQPVLEPLDKWVLNYADDSCRLARTFGKNEDKVLLVLDQFMPAGLLDLSLIGKRFGRFAENRVSLSSTFGPDLPAGEFQDALTGTVGPDKTAILMIGGRYLLNRVQVKGASDELFSTTKEQEDAVTELRIAASSMLITLHTGSMGPPLAAMRTCISDLVKTWGLDPAQQEALGRRPVPTTKPNTWLTSPDYPKEPLAKGASAIVRFRIMVGADGLPTKCVIQQATLSPEFTKLTCDLLMRRARFSPALDRAGKPVASFYTNSVRWLAP
ncbi:MAG: energy transducer TonB [Novosphingobium sp.]